MSTDRSDIVRGLKVYALPDNSFFELRVLDIPSGNRTITASGYFNDLDAAADAVAKYDGRGAVYMTLNPIKPGVEARCLNRIQESPKNTTRDNEIARRLRLLGDFDPKRPSGISSTDAEHAAAIACAKNAAKCLRDEHGWPNPTVIDSGNGAHLVYDIDEPNDVGTRDLLKRVLATLTDLFGDDTVDVDQAVFNAARIVKVPGTIAKKGDNTPARPHRRSVILWAPETAAVVTRAQLEGIAAARPVAHPPAPPVRRDGRAFDLIAFCQEHGIGVRSSAAWGDGTRHILESCVFDPSHTGTSSALFQFASGAISYKCQHNSCAGYSWADVREKFEPGYRERAPDRAAAESDDGAVIRRLASVTNLEYERERRRAAKDLGMRATALDKAVEDARQSFTDPEALVSDGAPITFEEVTPWPEPVELSRLLNDIVTAIRRFCVLPSHAVHAIAIRTTATWIVAHVETACLLAITSPTRGCGKTRLLEVLKTLVCRPYATANISGAALYHLVADHKPALLADERDSDREDANALRNLLNAGHRRANAFVTRMVAKSGGGWTLRQFPVFGFKAVARIGDFHSTLVDRAILVRIERAPRGAQLATFIETEAAAEHLHLRRKLARFAQDFGTLEVSGRPQMPVSLDGRARENWTTLLQVADLAGTRWSKRARNAAEHLVGGAREAGMDRGLALVRDIRQVFSEGGEERFPSVALVEQLLKIEEATWLPADGKPFGQRALAGMLRRFKIAPKLLRVAERVFRGYERSQFRRAWDSILIPSLSASQSARSMRPRV